MPGRSHRGSPPARHEDTKREWWFAWRGRVWERDPIENLVTLRNLVAHQQPGHTVMPVDSARALKAVAEFINALWLDPDILSGYEMGESDRG